MTFTYDSDGNPANGTSGYGYLTGFSGDALEAGTTITWQQDLPRTVTYSDGYSLTLTFDALNRLQQVDYPDGTNQHVVFDRLYPWKVYDRLGHYTTYTYTEFGQVATITDPKQQVTRFDWCNCGSMTSMTDGKNQVTTWEYDLEGRLEYKRPADDGNPSDTFWHYTYEPDTGRLARSICCLCPLHVQGTFWTDLAGSSHAGSRAGSVVPPPP